jgi:hypothetical protein
VLLLAPTTPAEVVRDVWASAPEHGGMAGQLDALMRHGISGLHPFAAVDLSSGGVQTALRGDVEVEVVRGTRAEVLTAPEVLSWSERSTGAAEEVTIRVAGAARGASLPIAAGVVRASRVRVKLTADAPAGGTDDVPVVRTIAQPVPVATFGVAAVEADAVVTAGDDLAAAAGDDLLAEEAVTADLPDVVEAADVEEPVVAEVAEPVAVVAAEHEVAVDAVGSDEGEVVAADAAAIGSDETDTDAEVTEQPEAEVVVPEDAAEIEPFAARQTAPEPEPALDTADEHPVDALPAPTWPPAPAPAPAVEHLDAAPAPAPAPEPEPAPAPALPGPASADDHDGLTIMSGELASIRQNLPSWAVSQTGEWPSGPAGVPQGAPVPQAVGVGAAGGYGVPGQAAVAVPAPSAPAEPVAHMHLSTGETVPLDRPVVLGRAPQAERAPAGSRLVAVPSPEQDISRSHAQVHVEQGLVLVTDLFSTNGVTVASGPLPARRITAGDPVAVGVGDVVDLGDGVTFTVEPGA